MMNWNEFWYGFRTALAVYGPFILAIFAILWAWLFFISVIPL